MTISFFSKMTKGLSQPIGSSRKSIDCQNCPLWAPDGLASPDLLGHYVKYIGKIVTLDEGTLQLRRPLDTFNYTQA